MSEREKQEIGPDDVAVVVVSDRAMTPAQVEARMRELAATHPPIPEPEPPTHYDVMLHGHRRDHDPAVHEPAEWPHEAHPVKADAPGRPASKHSRRGYVRMTAEQYEAHRAKHQASYDAWRRGRDLEVAKESRLRHADGATAGLVHKHLADLPGLAAATQALKDRIAAAKTLEELEAIADER